MSVASKRVPQHANKVAMYRCFQEIPNSNTGRDNTQRKRERESYREMIWKKVYSPPKEL